MLELLKRSLLDAQVIKRGQYNYFIHPLTDAIPRIEPKLMREICEAVAVNCDMNADTILTIEAMGIHIAATLSQMTGIAFNIVRKKQYWLPGEVVLDQSTGYSKGKLYINAIGSGDRLLVVDAVISTGGTMIAVINGLKKIGAEIVDILCVIERGDGVEKVKKETGYDVKTLVKIDVGDRVRILESIG